MSYGYTIFQYRFLPTEIFTIKKTIGRFVDGFYVYLLFILTTSDPDFQPGRLEVIQVSGAGVTRF